MTDILDEILKLNKLIKVLIKEEDIEAIEKSLNEKNRLMKVYGNQKNDKINVKKIESIKELDEENIENMKKLMDKTLRVITEIKEEKGQVKKKSQKLRKYNLPNSSSGYRFDRKK